MEPHRGMSTPWGVADHVHSVAEGVWFVGTPGHGGFYVGESRRKEMPKVLSGHGNRRWYEEDCDYALVIVGLPHMFPKIETDRALEVVRNWHPDEFEKYFKCSILPGKSTIKDEREFKEANLNRFVCQSAFGDWKEGVPKGMVGVYAVRESDGAEKWFLIPEDEYDARVRSFVVDESRHQETDSLTQRSKEVVMN